VSTVLITGGAGFIGSHVARKLVERGDKVVSLDTRGPDPEAAWWLRSVAGEIEYVDGTIDDWPGVVQLFHRLKPDRVIHTAAITSPPFLHRRPSTVLNVNLTGTFNLLEASRTFGLERFVNFSTVAVLPSIQFEPVTVNHPVLLGTEGPGGSFYGAGKIAAEALCWAYNQSYGFDFITIRPSAVYGFAQRYPIYIKPMVENAVRGIPTRFDHGREFPRDYTHVDDVAELTVLATHHPADQVQDRCFFGATGEPLVTAGDVADLVKDLVPGADVEIAPGLSEDDLVEIKYRGIMDISNSRQQLGFEPKYAHIRNGLAQYIGAYREYLEETGNA
jgi:nucleoside-diphosphate-sugar epimerase